ncbi:melatonin receptor type 1A-like [Epargyreus clarus]|uniref:melatonin receptor type 1A-like n=1 Tax=Epargyreus clarus TaxID=520877 RepID=UPI003C2B80BC
MSSELSESGAADNRTYSPLTLAYDWPKISRLLFLVACSCIGTIMNGFFVASFIVERSLRKVGNVFLACAGLADLIVTTVVMPTSAVVLLSGEWDVAPVCYFLHFLTESSTYSYSFLFLFVAAENYYRVCRTPEEYKKFVSMKVGVVVSLIFTLSFVTAGVGVYYELDYDYCSRLHYGNFYFRAITTVLFHGVPCLFTFIGLLIAFVRVQRRARKQVQYKRSQLFDRDFTSTTLNLGAYGLFALAWTPYLIVVHEFPGTSDAKFYHSAYIGLSRSIISSFLYAFMNRNFRRAYAHLFNYCCCKSTLSGSFASRHRRALEYRPATGDVRVHIMHQALNVNSPPRFYTVRETQEL